MIRRRSFLFMQRTINTTAWADIPSPRPENPNPSSVVALTLTCSMVVFSTEAILVRIVGICGAILGCWAIMVASRLPSRYPRDSASLMTCDSSLRLSAPLYAASVSGKCLPISPSPRAPRMASAMACSSTSASECPSRPRFQGISTPPMISFLPSTNRWTSYPCPMRIKSSLARLY